MYELLIAAVTNYHQRRGLKPHRFMSYSHRGQKSRISLMGLQSECWQRGFLLSSQKRVSGSSALLARGPLLSFRTAVMSL